MITTEIHYVTDCKSEFVTTLSLEFPMLVGDFIEIDLGGYKGFTELEVIKRQIDGKDPKNIQLEIHAREFK